LSGNVVDARDVRARRRRWRSDLLAIPRLERITNLGFAVLLLLSVAVAAAAA
jgi:hypothetical protein